MEKRLLLCSVQGSSCCSAAKIQSIYGEVLYSSSQEESLGSALQQVPIDAFLKETTAFCQHWHMETAALIFSMRESTADSEKYHFMVHGLSFALVHFTVLAAMQNNISC